MRLHGPMWAQRVWLRGGGRDGGDARPREDLLGGEQHERVASQQAAGEEVIEAGEALAIQEDRLAQDLLQQVAQVPGLWVVK